MKEKKRNLRRKRRKWSEGEIEKENKSNEIKSNNDNNKE